MMMMILILLMVMMILMCFCFFFVSGPARDQGADEPGTMWPGARGPKDQEPGGQGTGDQGTAVAFNDGSVLRYSALCALLVLLCDTMLFAIQCSLCIASWWFTLSEIYGRAHTRIPICHYTDLPEK